MVKKQQIQLKYFKILVSLNTDAKLISPLVIRLGQGHRFAAQQIQISNSKTSDSYVIYLKLLVLISNGFITSYSQQSSSGRMGRVDVAGLSSSGSESGLK